MIPAKGSKTSGFDSSYLDEEAKSSIAYCYALKDVDSKGKSKFYFEQVDGNDATRQKLFLRYIRKPVTQGARIEKLIFSWAFWC